MHYLITTYPGAGSQPPLCALALQLQEQGHQVTVAAYTEQQQTIESLGLTVVVFRHAQAIVDSFTTYRDQAIQGMIVSEAHLVDLPELAEELQPDALLIDFVMLGALTAVEAMGWTRKAYIVFHGTPAGNVRAFTGLLPKVNLLREKAGLTALETPDEMWKWAQGAPDAIQLRANKPNSRNIVCSIAELEEQADSYPRNAYTWIGPRACPKIYEQKYRQTSTADLERLLQRTEGDCDVTKSTVLISFTTMPLGEETALLQSCLTALSDASKYRVIATVAHNSIDKLQVPDNARCVSYAPHQWLLPHVDLVITHAGHGTLTAALSHGIPLVCIPGGTDQLILGPRVEALGAGLCLNAETVTSDQIQNAVHTVLTSSECAKGAQALQRKIAETLSQYTPLELD